MASVTLRTKEIEKKGYSLFLDIYNEGQRYKEYLKLYVSTHSSISPEDTTVAPWSPVVLTAFGGVSYQWNNPDAITQSISIISFRNTALFVVAVTDSNGCASYDTATVQTFPPLLEGVVLEDINAEGTTFNGCQADSFTWYVANNTDSNQTFAIKISTDSDIALTFALTNGPGTVTIRDTNVFISENLPAGSMDTITYRFSIPCTEFNSEGHQDLQQVISITADSLNAPYPGTYTVNNSAPYTLPLQVDYAVFTLYQNPGGIMLPVGGSGMRSFTYENDGDAAYQGELILHGGFPCDTNILRVTTVFTVNGTVFDSIVNAAYPYTIPDITVPAHEDLVVKQYVTLLTCDLSGCAEDSLFLQYGCPGDLCQETTLSGFTLTQKLDTPCIVVSRITPAPTSYDPQFAWDGSCVNTETSWEFLVINLGSAVAKNVTLFLAPDNDPHTHYTYIPDGTLQIDTGDPRFPTAPIPVFDTSSLVVLTDSDFPNLQPTACFIHLDSANTEPLKSYYLHVPQMQPGQNFVVRFNTWRCCADDNTFNAGIDFNRWQLQVNYNNCTESLYADYNVQNPAWLSQTYINNGDTTPTYNAFPLSNPLSGYISSNGFSPDAADLQLVQTFEQSVTDLTGQGGGGCGSPEMFSIDNHYFQGFDPSDYGTQLFCATDTIGGLTDVTGADPQGQFRVEFKVDSGVQFTNSLLPFIESGSLLWYPVSIDTTGPFPFAIFDIAAGPYHDTSGALIAQSFPTAYDFRVFFEHSSINFYLQTCCPAPPSGVITVNTLFNPKINGQDCDTCFIPLSQVKFTIQLLCPGCVTPGVITYNFETVRTNFGFADLDDNGLPDGGSLSRIDSSYEKFNQINRTGSIAGDTIMGIASAFFEDGSDTGFSYSAWQAYWAGERGGDTPRITHLYFETQDSGASTVGLKCIGAQLLYKPAGSTVTSSYTLPGVSGSSPLFPDASGKMVFDFPLDSAPYNIVVQVRDSFKILTQYVVCQNPDTMISLNIFAEAFMSDTVLTSADPYSGVSEVGDIYNKNDSVYEASDSGRHEGAPGFNPSVPGIWICQAYEAVHYVYPMVSTYSEEWDNSPPSCSKTARIAASYYINGPYQDIFQYEYRPMPYINPFDNHGPRLANGNPVTFYFTLPQGYSAYVDSVWTSFYDYSIPMEHPYVNIAVGGNVVDSPDTLIGPYSFNYMLDTTKALYLPPFAVLGFDTTPVQTYTLQNVIAGGMPALLLGDEYFKEEIQFHITPICSTALSPIDTIRPGDDYAIIPQFGNACNAPSDLVLDSTSGFPFYLTIPDPKIYAVQNGAVTFDSSYGEFVFSIADTPGEISNLFFYMDIDQNQLPPGMSVVDLTALPDSASIPLAIVTSISGTDTFARFSIGNLDTVPQKFLLRMLLTNCELEGVDQKIALHYFWSCDGQIWKLPVDSPTLCGAPDSFLMYFQPPPVGIQTKTYSQGPYTTCSFITDSFYLNITGNGGVGNITADLRLPKDIGVTSATAYMLGQGGGYTPPVGVTSDTIAGSTDKLWHFDLDTATAFGSSEVGPGGLTGGHCLYLYVTFFADCHVDSIPESQLTFNGNLYCGYSFEQARDSFPDFDSIICYIPAAAISNGCGPYAIATTAPCGMDSITFTTSLGTYGVPPLDTSWLPGIPNFAMPDTGTYYVTVTDSNGCVGKDSVDVNDTMHISATNSNASCSTLNNGSSYITVSGGTAPYHYHWNNGDTTQNRTGLGAGLYYLTVTDIHACTATKTITIGLEDNLQLSFTNERPGCLSAVGSISATITAGTPPYLYLWEPNGDTTSGLTHLDSTYYYVLDDTFTPLLDTSIYILTVTDSAGCIVTKSDTLTTYAGMISFDTIINNPCNDSLGSIAITSVLFGTPPYSYRWNNGDTTSVISNLSGGTSWFVTITDAAGCISENDSAHALKIIKDSLQLHFSNSTTCFTDSPQTMTGIVSGGTLPFSYTWSSALPDTTAIKTVTTGGMYALTVTDSLRCSVSATDTLPTITTLSVTDSVVSNFGSSSSGAIYLTNVSGGTAPITYVWSNDDTSRNLTGLSGGTYSVTVTDAHGCTATITAFVHHDPAYAVCFTHPDDSIIALTADTVYSNTLHIPADSQVYIAPGVLLIVDSTLVLKNCEVVLGYNSEIDVEEGDTLEVLGSTLEGCDSMWQGILVETSATIIMDSLNSQNSILQDAVTGIFVPYAAYMTIHSTDFYRDLVGISLYTYVGTNEDISNCYFGMGNYTAMLPSYGIAYKRPQAGIYMNYCDTLYIPNPAYSGLPNTFQGMNNGVFTIGSYLDVANNFFDSIKQYDTIMGTSAAVNAIGFTALGGFGGVLVQTSTTLPDTSSPITFKNCDVGVYAAWERATVVGNRMENVSTGIEINGVTGEARVDSNYIHQTNFGISLQYANQATQIVQSNTIYVNDPPPPVEIYGGPFIVYPNTFGVGQIEQSNVIPGNTTIDYNWIYNGKSSITLTNANGTIVNNDTLHQSSRGYLVTRVSGIYAQNCSGLQVADNYSDGIGSGYVGGVPQLLPASQKVGIWFNNSQSSQVFCNTLGSTDSIAGLNVGMAYTANCIQTNIYNDTMNKSNYGISLEAAGSGPVISSQGVNTIDSAYGNDNIFNGNGDASHTFSNNNSYRTYTSVNDTNYHQSPIFWYVGIDETSNTGVTDPSGSSQTGDAVIAQPVTDTPALSRQICAISFHLIIHSHGDQFDSIVASDSAFQLMEPGYETTGEWLADKILFRELRADTALRNSDSIFQKFYTQTDTSDIGIISNVEDTIAHLWDSVVISDPKTFDDVLTDARSLNSAIPTANAQAANFAAVNAIYLNMLYYNVDTFTSDQVSYLYSMAQLCPYGAGDAVYIARALYAQIDNTVFFDDRDACGAHDYYRSLEIKNNPTDTTTLPTSKEFVNLYPNPARDVINLSYFAQTQGQVYFEMFDALGNNIKEEKIPNGITFEEYSTQAISSGVYHWRLRDSERVIKSGKIVIIK